MARVCTQGLPFHNHDAAWQAVARGAKLFLLLPPLRPRKSPSQSAVMNSRAVSDRLLVFSAAKAAEEAIVKAMGEKLERVLLPHPRDFVAAHSAGGSRCAFPPHILPYTSL